MGIQPTTMGMCWGTPPQQQQQQQQQQQHGETITVEICMFWQQKYKNHCDILDSVLWFTFSGAERPIIIITYKEETNK